MTTTEIEEIRRHLNEIQLVCDDERMPQKLCNRIMKHQRAVKDALGDDHRIAIVWSVEDVQAQCPGLNEDQAREVLDFVENKHDATIGINWDTIEMAAVGLFPDVELHPDDDDEEEEDDDDES